MKSRSLWPLGIIAFFLVLFSFNFWFLYQASNSNLGLVDVDPYEQSYNYQQIIDKKLINKTNNFSTEIKILNGFANVKVLQGSSTYLEPLELKLDAICLSRKDGKIEEVLNKKDGDFFVSSSPMKSGQWLMKISATNSNGELVLYDERKIII